MIKSKKSLWFVSILTVAFFIATFFIPVTMAAADTTVFDDNNTATFDDSGETTFSDDDGSTSDADGSESSVQTNNTDTTGDDSPDESSNVAEIIDEPILNEVIEDETVNEQDLEVKTPGRFYFFKNAARNIQKALTFNPIKKAEIELKQASEQLLHAQELAENSDDPEIQEKITKAVAKYETRLGKIRTRADKIAEQTPEIRKHFMDRLTNKQMKQQKILDKLKDKLPEHAFIRVREAKERSFEHLGDVMNRVIDNPEEMTSRIVNVMENQRGSEFRDLKNIEFLKGLEEYIPDEAKEAVMNARYQTMERFNEHMYDIPEEIRAEKFAKYIEFMNGDPTRQMKILDEMKGREFMSEDITMKIEHAKDLAIKKFEHRIKQIRDEDIRDRFFRPLERGEMDDLKIIRELEENMDPEIKKEIEQRMDETHQQSIKKFKEKFADNSGAQATADRFKLLSKKMKENPDPATFEMIQELERNLPPEQREFIKKMKEQAQGAFADKFAEYDDKFIDRFATNDPRHLEMLRDLKFDLPPGAMRGIETAIAAQVENIERKMEEMEDPEEFFEFRKRIELDERTMDEMRRYKPTISEDMGRFQFEKIEHRFDEFDNPEEMIEYREKFERRVNKDKEFKDRLFKEDPEFFSEIDKRQFKAFENRMDTIKNPDEILEFRSRIDDSFESRPELKTRIQRNVPNFWDDIDRKQVESIKDRFQQRPDDFNIENIEAKMENHPEFREKFFERDEGFFREIKTRRSNNAERDRSFPNEEAAERAHEAVQENRERWQDRNDDSEQDKDYRERLREQANDRTEDVREWRKDRAEDMQEAQKEQMDESNFIDSSQQLIVPDVGTDN